MTKTNSKLTHTSDAQLAEDAAQMLINAHLGWSGSDKGMPSRDHDNIRGAVIEAYLEANFTDEEWDEMTESSQKLAESMAAAIFKRAAQIADRKWEAAMILLGIEQ